MKPVILVSCVCLALLTAANKASAMGGLLKEPSLSHSPGRSVTKLMAVLTSKEQKFTGGFFINWDTHLYYAGNTAKLDRFLTDLTNAGGQVHLHFSKESSGGRLELGQSTMKTEPAQWEVHHNTSVGEDRFDVTVYLGDGKIDLEKLHLPPMRGETH